MELSSGSSNLAQGSAGLLVWGAVGLPHEGCHGGVWLRVVVQLQAIGEVGGNAGGAVTVMGEGLNRVGLGYGDVVEATNAVDVGECNVGFGGGARE